MKTRRDTRLDVQKGFRRFSRFLPYIALAVLITGSIEFYALFGIPLMKSFIVDVDTAQPSINTAVPTSQAVPTYQTRPLRLTIDPGQTTMALVGVINPNETIQYVIAAAQGQTLRIKLTALSNEVAIGVKSPTGLVIKPLDASPAWSTSVTFGGDYLIYILSLTGPSSKSYTLEVSLTSPRATSTAVATLP